MTDAQDCPREGVGEIGTSGESLGGVLGECHGEHRVERLECRTDVRQVRGWRAEVAADHHGGVGVREQRGPGQQVEGGGGQRVLIGAAVDRFVRQLLGRRIGEGADHHVRRGQAAGIIDVPGYTEVAQQDSLFTGLPAGEQDVRGADIAVQHVMMLVCVVERPGDRFDDVCDLLCRHADRILVAQQARCVGAVDEVHRDPQLPVELASVVDAHDVRVPQRGSQVRLSDEALAVCGVGGNVVVQYLERLEAR